MEYLEDRHPEPALLPADPAGRARARLAVFRFDDLLGDDYYALRRGEDNAVADRLALLPVGESAFVDFAYLPWVMRLRELYGVTLPDRLEAWLGALSAGLRSRPSSRSSGASHDRHRRRGAGGPPGRGGRGRRPAARGVRRLARRALRPSPGPLPGARQPAAGGARVPLPRGGTADGSGSPRAPRSSPTATAARARRPRCRSSRSLGYDARNYSGSWHEWSRTDLPFETRRSYVIRSRAGALVLVILAALAAALVLPLHVRRPRRRRRRSSRRSAASRATSRSSGSSSRPRTRRFASINWGFANGGLSAHNNSVLALYRRHLEGALDARDRAAGRRRLRLRAGRGGARAART